MELALHCRVALGFMWAYVAHFVIFHPLQFVYRTVVSVVWFCIIGMGVRLFVVRPKGN